MGNTYIADPVGKESTTEAEAPFLLEIKGNKAKLYTKYGECLPGERTLDQWLCACLNGTIFNTSVPGIDEFDIIAMADVADIAKCIFPIDKSSYRAIPLLARLQIIMQIADWTPDVNMGIRYHNGRDLFYGKMQEIMPNTTADDMAKIPVSEFTEIERRFHDCALACQRNSVDFSKWTFEKRLMFNSITELATHLLIYFVEHEWMLQRCPVCKKFYRAPSLKRETCSEDCKRANERRKKKESAPTDNSYHSAKNTFLQKCERAHKGQYIGRDGLKEDFVKLLGFNDDEKENLRKSLDMDSNVFSAQEMDTIKEWLKAQMEVVRQERRIRRRGGPNDRDVPSYEDFVRKFEVLQKGLRFSAKNSEKYDIGQKNQR